MQNRKPYRPTPMFLEELPHDSGICPHTKNRYNVLYVEGQYLDNSVKKICTQCNQVL